MDRTAKVVADETALIREQLRRNDIGLITGGGGASRTCTRS